MTGRFITLEGGDGVGKSTNVSVVRDYLVSRGCSVILTREPGGSIAGEKIRHIFLNSSKLTAYGELLLLFAARAQHLEEVIVPALNKGEWVVCDRYVDASYAYQGAARGMNEEFISVLEEHLPQASMPDLTLLLDAPVNVGISIAKSRGAVDRFDDAEAGFCEQVRQGYLRRAAQHPARIKIIDATMPLEDVAVAIRAELGRLFQ